MNTLRERGLRTIHAKLDLAEKLGDRLVSKMQASPIQDERYRGVDELRRTYLIKAEGMAEILQKLDIITDDEMYTVFDLCAHLEGREKLLLRRGG